MRNNGLDIMQVGISCGLHICQHIFAVKDIQAFIFHRAHIEMANGDNLE